MLFVSSVEFVNNIKIALGKLQKARICVAVLFPRPAKILFSRALRNNPIKSEVFDYLDQRHL